MLSDYILRRVSELSRHLPVQPLGSNNSSTLFFSCLFCLYVVYYYYFISYLIVVICSTLFLCFQIGLLMRHALDLEHIKLEWLNWINALVHLNCWQLTLSGTDPVYCHLILLSIESIEPITTSSERTFRLTDWCSHVPVICFWEFLVT